MPRKNMNLSNRHAAILSALSKRLDISQTETVQRALESLEEKESQREKEVSKNGL